MTALIYDPAEWPHGLRCIDCERAFNDEEIYSHRLAGITTDGSPIVEVVCAACALGLKDAS